MTDPTPPDPLEYTCPACHARWKSKPKDEAPYRYCPFCRAALNHDHLIPTVTVEPPPESSDILFSIGPYHILESIGKGGMGEVFLAYDTLCGRRIALKRIRPDLLKYTQLHHRFLKEAWITSQLTHPSIISTYAIQSESDLVYYTMPFVEGRTLRQILATAHDQAKKGLKLDHLSTIPALMRIFLAVCQAVGYAHSKRVIHRDLKPTNIIVGRYGEVLILDWGLALQLSEPSEKEFFNTTKNSEGIPHDTTRLGRVVGTLAYMSPERAMGYQANYQTDIYSLGVILYQILTLHHPFHRHSLKEFRKNMAKEVLYSPEEIAPYRDVPPVLSRIVKKCLAPVSENRYQTVEALIQDLETYMEGRSEWFAAAKLKIQRKSDWEFQENVLLAENLAITRGPEVSDWVSLMISKASFLGNTKITARIRIGEHGQGIGFLLSIPEAPQRAFLNHGYCLWIGSDRNGGTHLLRSAVEVLEAPDVMLERGSWYDICIEKVENNIHFYLNNRLQFSYISHLTISGTHVGLLARDADFELADFSVYLGSQNIQVNCLAIPHAFLAQKHYLEALQEYRRIATVFPGTAEGRDALFGAGIALLEAARNSDEIEERLRISDEALDEFTALRQTPGAPLEYLGKALVYQFLDEPEEEVKCFELAHRRYPKHSLLPMIQEQLVYRLHECSRKDRQAAYNFALLAARFLPGETAATRKLFNSLKSHWEPLDFMEEISTEAPSDLEQRCTVVIPMAFWLNKPNILVELIDELSAEALPSIICIGNALFALLELREEKLVKETKVLDDSSFQLIKAAIEDQIEELFALLPVVKGVSAFRAVSYPIQKALDDGEGARAYEIASRCLELEGWSEGHRIRFDCWRIWALLRNRNWAQAGELLQGYSLEHLIHENSLMHFLYGCWLYVTEGKEIAMIHFSSLLEVSYPRSWTLFGYFFSRPVEERDRWLQRAFAFEKRQYYRQCALFQHCLGEKN